MNINVHQTKFLLQKLLKLVETWQQELPRLQITTQSKPRVM